MKPVAALVEAAVNVDLLAERIIVALADERQADTSAARWEQQAAAARETSKVRRREIGEALLKARGAWPDRGPNAKGWGEFLKRVGLEQSTAWRYMDDARTPERPGFMQPHENSAPEPAGDRPSAYRDVKPENAPEPEVSPAVTEAAVLQLLAKLDPDARKRVARELRTANVNGGSGDAERGTWCTPKKYAHAVGPWDLDPFSNRRSHVAAARRCALEDSGNGLLDPAVTGSYSAPPAFGRADASTRVWIQPPYDIVDQAIAHYGHTRFCALLRFDPSTEWFAQLWALTTVVAIPFGERLEFEPPPGIEASANPYPHAFYYRDERDVTDEIRRLCIVLRVEH